MTAFSTGVVEGFIGEAEQMNRRHWSPHCRRPVIAAHASSRLPDRARPEVVAPIAASIPGCGAGRRQRKLLARPGAPAEYWLGLAPSAMMMFFGSSSSVPPRWPSRASFHRAAIDQRLFAQYPRFARRPRRQDRPARRSHCREGGLLIRPDDDLLALPLPIAETSIVTASVATSFGALGSSSAVQLCALERAAQPYPPSAWSTPCAWCTGEQVEPRRASIDIPAKAVAARGANLPDEIDLVVEDIADRPAMQAAGIDERIAGIDRATRGLDIDAAHQRGVDRDPPGEREAACIELDFAARILAARRKDRAGKEIAAVICAVPPALLPSRLIVPSRSCARR